MNLQIMMLHDKALPNALFEVPSCVSENLKQATLIYGEDNLSNGLLWEKGADIDWLG